MAQYYFDFRDGIKFVRDEEGTDLQDFNAAREEAISTLPQVARDQLPDGEHREFEITIRQLGVLLYRATLTFHGERL